MHGHFLCCCTLHFVLTTLPNYLTDPSPRRELRHLIPSRPAPAQLSPTTPCNSCIQVSPSPASAIGPTPKNRWHLWSTEIVPDRILPPPPPPSLPQLFPSFAWPQSSAVAPLIRVFSDAPRSGSSPSPHVGTLSTLPSCIPIISLLFFSPPACHDSTGRRSTNIYQHLRIHPHGPSTKGGIVLTKSCTVSPDGNWPLAASVPRGYPERWREPQH